MERPFVTPEEVKSYTDFDTVKNRDDEKLKIDIMRAESHIIALTHNDFKDYDEIPMDIKTAIIIVADCIANNAVEQTTEMSSETYDDYSYIRKQNITAVEDLDIACLIEPYIKDATTGKVGFKLRAL